MSTDNPGSPNLPAGLANLPIYTTVGGTLGVVQNFNRLKVTVKGTFDRSKQYPNYAHRRRDRQQRRSEFNQYAGVARVGYELDAGFKPFVEVNGDERVHDQKFDSNGQQRSSTGTSVKVGACRQPVRHSHRRNCHRLSRPHLPGPDLPNIAGLIADGALIWQASALTTVKCPPRRW